MVRISAPGAALGGVSRATLRRRAQKMLAYLGLRGVELSLVLAGEPEMRALGRHYLGGSRATDVLAFPMIEGEPVPQGTGLPELLGDVVMCVPVAARQARRLRRNLLAELTTLLAHGLLHLCGHDHLEPAAARRMAALAVELERAAGRRSAGGPELERE
ncbi:MAG: rRNA maturation RNase YbeY [Deltaproteobacteria bacterium]|nr:rRNA maturation RNase YbeY [Deltaproteobacteria bacterium]